MNVPKPDATRAEIDQWREDQRTRRRSDGELTPEGQMVADWMKAGAK